MNIQQSSKLPFEELIAGSFKDGTGDWHHELCKRAFQKYVDVGWPGVKNESWKYTNLNKLGSHSFSIAKDHSTTIPEDMIIPLDCPRLVLVNGVFNSELSNQKLLNDGLTLTLLANVNDYQKTFFDNLGSGKEIKDELPLASLNTAMFSDALVLELAEGIELSSPIHIISIGSGCQITFAPRILVNVGKGGKLDVIESHVGDSSGMYFSNSVVQFNLQDDAKVGHYKLQNESKESFHISLTKVLIKERASYDNFTISLGGILSRNEIQAHIAGSGAECCVNGTYLGLENQHIDNTTFIEHISEGSCSREVFKGVLGDKARGVFQGKILVHPDAQKTDGYQMNRAMLLSDQAEIDSKPELEIYADDVRCSHGATVGELEEEHIFYLCARGIGRERARRMLIGAYINDAIDEIKNADIRSSIQGVAENWLKHNLHEKK